MSQKERILDDVARVAGGAVGVFTDVKKHAKDTAKSFAQDAAHSIDLVPREDYEALEAIVHKLIERVDALEKTLNTKKKDKS